MPQYIIYCRKSTESEERQVLSIESQMKELTDLIKRLNLGVSETLTESKSAKQPGRPVFNEIMKRIYKGQVKGIICWKLDRLARNPIDGSSLIWALDQGKISEILTPHNTFKNNSNDKFLMQIEFGMAKKYVDDLSDNVKRGNRAKLERGWYPGLAPMGYLNEPKERTIVKDPERFPIIRKMWDLLLQGIRPAQILKVATEEWGFRTPVHKRIGGKPLSLSGLYKLFGNPFYYGLIERKEGVFQGIHEPMITEDEFWKVHEILGRKGRPRPQKHQ
ncbi:MAG: recombinase family protein, partial [Nitrospirota bacterium]